MPLERRTRATLRSAEFGFLGVLVYTRVHTPRRWGAPFSAGVLPLVGFDWRPLRTSCWMVGTTRPFERTLLVALRSRAGGRGRGKVPRADERAYGGCRADRKPLLEPGVTRPRPPGPRDRRIRRAGGAGPAPGSG